MKNLKRILTLLLAICMMLTVLAGCGDTSTDTNDNTVDNTTDSTGDTADTDDTGDTTEKPVSKIAILLPGYITDQSWNQGAYEGLKELESQGYEIAYTEDVQAANMESTFRTYCEDGYDFVIGHGVQYGDACVRVAEDYPNVYFFITGNPPEGDNLPSNIAFYDYKEYEGAYVCGYLAALMSESNIISAAATTPPSALTRTPMWKVQRLQSPTSRSRLLLPVPLTTPPLARRLHWP